jgi:hypothetical protein
MRINLSPNSKKIKTSKNYRDDQASSTDTITVKKLKPETQKRYVDDHNIE